MEKVGDRRKSSIKFVNLHGHSSIGSPFDALDLPPAHMDYAWTNGCDGLALTDHGNASGHSYAVLHQKKMRKEGKPFKSILGAEAYFVPSINDWKEQKKQADEEKEKEKKQKKEQDQDDLGGAIIENENETKGSDKKNSLRRRSHLVVLAQNLEGLSNLYQLVSKSFKEDNFYYYPRIDFEMLREHNKGLIVSSACLGGVLSNDYWQNKDNGEEAILNKMRQTCSTFISIFGDRFFGELQYIKHLDQHKVNQYIIQVSKELGFGLISTADSHYSQPDKWKDRLLYKELGWLGRGGEVKQLPKTLEEVGYHLYPKNGDQMWEDYKKYSSMNGIQYDDDIIRESIEKTYDIAFQMIEDFSPDTTIKLPDFVVPEGKDPNEVLREKCFYGMGKLGIDNPSYRQRVEKELNVLARNGFSKYFLTMDKIKEVSENMGLTGVGRGSAAGSLVAYTLGITQVDPIKWGLLFERFLTIPAPVGYHLDGIEDNKAIKAKVDKLVKITMEDGQIIYLTENLVKEYVK